MCYEFDLELYRRAQEQQRRVEEERRAKEQGTREPPPAKPKDTQPEPVPV